MVATLRLSLSDDSLEGISSSEEPEARPAAVSTENESTIGTGTDQNGENGVGQTSANSGGNQLPHKSMSFFKSINWYDWHINTFRAICDYLRRVFSFPLVSEPIAFSRPGDFTITGEFDPSQNKANQRSDEMSDLSSYDQATKEAFQIILRERESILEAKDKYHYQDVDLSKFPLWDETIIERLKSTFQVFDVTGDGLIDFEEMSSVLTNFGDKSSETIRRKHFDAVDIDNSGAMDFEEFLTMAYNLNLAAQAGSVDQETVQFVESYRMVDRNMSRIRSLDVVQQLQSGLF